MRENRKHITRSVLLLLSVLVLVSASFSCVGVAVGPEGKIGKVYISLKPGVQPPVINYFNANPQNISSGEAAVLEWDVSGASDVTIEPGIGNVDLVDSVQVSPTTTTTYSLAANNAAGVVTESVIITVDGGSLSPSPEPPPSPAPSSSLAINSFIASPAAIDTGETCMLSWDVSGATSVSIAPGIGSVSASGSATVSPSGTTSYTLTASDANGSITRSVTVTVASAPPPAPSAPVINYFTADPATIYSGGSSVLRWDVLQATAISIDQGIGSIPYTTGLGSVHPSATTTYTLTATGPGGTTTRSVTVTVTGVPPSSLPVVNYFTASPGSITAGGSSTLGWSVSGATSLSITPGGAVPASGSATVSPGSTTIYTLVATNSAGTVSRQVTVTVSAAPPSAPVVSYFTASPGSITAGGSSTLSWSVSGATSLSIAPGGAVPASGTATVSPGSTTTYTLTATGAGGTTIRTVTVTVSAAPPPPPADVATCEQALFNAVNVKRASAGIAPLTRNALIDGLCRTHAQYMAASGVLSHDNVTTRCETISASIPGLGPCAENVLQNNIPCNAAAMAQQWYDSAGHRTNMLNAAYTISGMGIAIDGSGRIWACQIFVGP